MNFQTFTFYRPKIAWSDVTKFDLQQKIFGRFWFSLHETTPNWCPERCAKFHVDTVINEEVIPEKPRGGGSDPTPPRRWRVNIQNFSCSTFSINLSHFSYTLRATPTGSNTCVIPFILLVVTPCILKYIRSLAWASHFSYPCQWFALRKWILWPVHPLNSVL